MARLARVVAVGEPHHLTQRGNNRQTTFLDDHDRRTYCQLLAEHAKRAGIRVLGYCLMTNHVHLVAIPERADSFARGLGRAHYLYTRALHERWGGSGHLWQNRFFSCPLDRDHLWTALRYVDLNPLRAGLVEEATAYEWSSARSHAERQDPLGLLDGGLWGELCGRQDWREMLGPTRMEEADAVAALRQATMTGRPLGGESFVKRLEGMFARKLKPKRTGRPKKATAAAA
jgi:REP-associated tyrosine transposase